MMFEKEHFEDNKRFPSLLKYVKIKSLESHSCGKSDFLKRKTVTKLFDLRIFSDHGTNQPLEERKWDIGAKTLK